MKHSSFFFMYLNLLTVNLFVFLALVSFVMASKYGSVMTTSLLLDPEL